MRIAKLSLNNFRTFDEIEFQFPDFYTAICGQNDAGKSNVIKALQILLGEEEPYYRRRSASDLSITNDYPKWIIEKQKSICISVDINIHKEFDAGLYSFISDYLDLEATEETIHLTLKNAASDSASPNGVTVVVGEKEFTDLKAQEVNKKLRSTLLVHNSTEAGYRLSYIGELDEFSDEYGAELDEISKKASNSLKRVAKSHKEEITNLLGRLSRKHKVEISLPDISLKHFPYDITLGDSKIDVALSEWGSGTKNRTMIFLALLKARQISQSVVSASKVTPVLVIEEPESFLHPSAQAEFGRILQDLPDEFGVQVITSTHSPYMLSKDRPESNILLERKQFRGQYRESQKIDTSGDNWMEPFSLILGLSSEEFRPWKELFFGNSEATILVEGETDKQYFEMLRSDIHGSNKLKLDGSIITYDGFGALKNPALLRFIKNRSRSSFVTYDLDIENEVRPVLERNGFVHKEDFLGLGANKPGKRAIEGLLPDTITNAVNGANNDLVQQAIYGTKDEQKSAKSQLKRLYLEEFQSKSKPTAEYFGEFYKVVRAMNDALCK